MTRASTARPIFAVQLQAAPNVDATRALRSLLKNALRRHGLRAVTVTEIAASAASRSDDWRSSARENKGRRNRRTSEMDMTKYAGTVFLKVDDVREKPIVAVIEAIKIGSYDKPVATFIDGSQLSLNMTNVRHLMKALGPDSRDWLGHTVELALGQTEYQGEMTDTILVKVLSEAKPPQPKPPLADEMEDAIPF